MFYPLDIHQLSSRSRRERGYDGVPVDTCPVPRPGDGPAVQRILHGSQLHLVRPARGCPVQVVLSRSTVLLLYRLHDYR